MTDTAPVADGKQPRRSNLNRPTEPPARAMPTSGLASLAQLLPFVNVSGQTWRKLVHEGKAPRPRVEGHRRHLWRWNDIRHYIDGLDARGRRRITN